MEPPDLDDARAWWILSPSEREATATKNAANRLSFAVFLTFFRHAGCFPRSLAEIDDAAIASLAEQLGVDAALHPGNDELDRTTKRHRAEIRTFFGFREATVDDGEDLLCWLRDDDRLAAALQGECRRRRIEPPAPERFDRIIRSAVHACEEHFYAQTVAKLTPLMQAKLDALLQPKDGDESDAALAVITVLRSDAGRAGVNSIRDELAKLEIIRNLGLPPDLFAHALPYEIELYRRRVAVEETYELRRHPEAARRTWLAAFAYLRGRSITDTLTDLLVDTVHRINAKADRRVDAMLLNDLKHVTGKRSILFKLAGVTTENPDGVVREVVFPAVSESTLRDLVQEAKVTGPAFRNTLRDFIRNSYKSHYRQMLPQVLDMLDFRSNNEMHRPVIQALEIIKKYARTKVQHFPIEEDIPLDFLPPLWREAAVDDEVDGRPYVNRITYEIAALNALRVQVRCKEVWVEGADRYRNPDDDVPTDFEARREEYYAALNLPRDPETFIAGIREQMRTELQTLNDGLPRNPSVRISDKAGGWIHLTPLEAQPEPQNITDLKTELGRIWPMTSLLDMIKEADLRLKFTDALRSVTSYENLERDVLQPRLLLCLHGIGTNAGLHRMNTALPGATYKELAYVRKRYLNVDGLRNANGIISNGTLSARNPSI
jgi:hypothetical protein